MTCLHVSPPRRNKRHRVAAQLPLRGSADAAWKLDGDIVPDVVAPALQHARAGHDVQAVACDVRVGAQQPRAVYWQEVDVAELGR